MEEIVGGLDGQDRLERRWLTHGDLNRVEAAPGLAPHANAAVRAGHPGELADDLHRIIQFLLGVFTRRHGALGGAGTTDVHRRHDVAAPREVRMPLREFVFTVGVQIEEHRERFAREARRWLDEGDGEPHAVPHGKSFIFSGKFVNGWSDIELGGYRPGASSLRLRRRDQPSGHEYQGQTSQSPLKTAQQSPQMHHG